MACRIFLFLVIVCIRVCLWMCENLLRSIFCHCDCMYMFFGFFFLWLHIIPRCLRMNKFHFLVEDFSVIAVIAIARLLGLFFMVNATLHLFSWVLFWTIAFFAEMRKYKHTASLYNTPCRWLWYWLTSLYTLLHSLNLLFHLIQGV